MEKLEQIIAVVLAGGRATRMAGQDKGLLLLNGQPLWWHVASRLAPQTGQVVINANRHFEDYQRSGLQVIRDTLPGYPGPLAGMLAAMQQCDGQWYLFCPCDTPFLPDDLAWRLWQARRGPAVWAHAGEQDHPTIALLHHSLAATLDDFLRRGERQVIRFLCAVGGHSVIFSAGARHFINVNTPQDLCAIAFKLQQDTPSGNR